MEDRHLRVCVYFAPFHLEHVSPLDWGTGATDGRIKPHSQHHQSVRFDLHSIAIQRKSYQTGLWLGIDWPRTVTLSANQIYFIRPLSRAGWVCVLLDLWLGGTSTQYAVSHADMQRYI